MRKLLLVLLGTVVMAVMLAVATPVALASHGAGPSFVPVPSHGSIWMGSGLERYDITIPAQMIEGDTLNWPSEARFVIPSIHETNLDWPSEARFVTTVEPTGRP